MPGPLTPAATLSQLRLVWAVMVLGIVSTTAILFMFLGGPMFELPFPAVFVPLAILMLGGPVAYFARLQTYKAGWRGDAVAPQAYATGNFILFAVLEAAGLAGGVLAALTPDTAPCLVAGGLALILMALNYPNGGPMEPRSPQL